MDKGIQLVGFRIGRQTFGLPISTVREIIRVPEITSVPDAPNYVEGVINLRGRIIPVIDLRRRFGASAADADKKNRIVVVELETRAIGLIVNSASEVLKFQPSEIDQPNNVFREGELNYVTGVGKLKDRLVILLDVARMLQDGHFEQLDAALTTETPIPQAPLARI